MDIDFARAIVFGGRRRGSLARMNPQRGVAHFRRESAKMLDDFFFRSLGSLGVDVLIECGAHGAEASTRFSESGKKAIAIEANPTTFKAKTSRAAGVGVEVLNIGVGARAGELEFYVPISDSQAGNATFQKKVEEQYETKIVSIDTVDNILAARNLNHSSSALWIDVEGFSRDVLLGARLALEAGGCRIAKVEVENEELFSGQALASEVIALFRDFGYVPIAFDFEYETQYNIVFVRTDLEIALSVNREQYFSQLMNADWGVTVIARDQWRALYSKLQYAVRVLIFLFFNEEKANVILAKLGSQKSKNYLRRQLKDQD